MPRTPQPHLDRALHAAIRAGDEEDARRLVREGADPLAREAWSQTNALYAASLSRRDAIVSDLLLQDPRVLDAINRIEQPTAGWTALHAVYAGDVGFDDLAAHDTARALLRHGADPLVPDRQGRTALDLAITIQASASLAVLLAYPGAQEHFAAHLESCPADIARDDALRAGDARGYARALERGACADLDEDLMLAARAGRPELVTELLARGADVEGVEEGTTPLIRTAAELNSRGNHAATIAALISAGADVNAGTDQGNTALHHAAFWRHPERVQALLAGGADATLRNHQGETAAEMGDRDLSTATPLGRQRGVSEYRDAKGVERNAIAAQFLRHEVDSAPIQTTRVRSRRM